ncbi:MAG: hypothetical protein LUG96_13040 [Tannerellaceae bacterium]|nr:hypothetical protein [Tannerellaceae bacterium]
MKKLILLFVAIFSFIACEGPMGPEGPAGESGLSYWFVDDFTVSRNQWSLVTDADGLNAHYACDVRIDELTWEIYDDALIKLYVFLDPADTDAGMIELPDIYPFQDIDTGSTYDIYCGAILYEGGVKFTVKYSDFADNVLPPTMKFHVVFVY